jgi:hypothetical protein
MNCFSHVEDSSEVGDKEQQQKGDQVMNTSRARVRRGVDRAECGAGEFGDVPAEPHRVHVEQGHHLSFSITPHHQSAQQRPHARQLPLPRRHRSLIMERHFHEPPEQLELQRPVWRRWYQPSFHEL